MTPERQRISLELLAQICMAPGRPKSENARRPDITMGWLARRGYCEHVLGSRPKMWRITAKGREALANGFARTRGGVTLPLDALELAEAEAARSGKTVSAVVADLIRKHIGEKP